MFLEEFIKKTAGAKSRDTKVFKNLAPDDQENINEILRNLKISYAAH